MLVRCPSLSRWHRSARTRTAPDTHQEGQFHNLSLPSIPTKPVCGLPVAHSRFYLVWKHVWWILPPFPPTSTLHSIRTMSSLKTKGWASPIPWKPNLPRSGEEHLWCVCILPEQAGLPPPTMSPSPAPSEFLGARGVCLRDPHHPQLPHYFGQFQSVLGEGNGTPL